MDADPIIKNIALTQSLIAAGRTPGVLGIVSGSPAAKRYWGEILEKTRGSFKAKKALSFAEDLPVGQALGLLLLWERMRSTFDTKDLA